MKAVVVLMLSSFTVLASAADEPVVVVEVDGPSGDARIFLDSVSEVLSRMHVHTARDEPASGDVLARVRVDLRAGHVALHGKYEQRSFEHDVTRDTPAIMRETLADEIRAGVEAQLFEAERIAAEAAKPPPAAPSSLPVLVVPAPTPPLPLPLPLPKAAPASSKWRVDVGALVAGGPVGDDSGVAPRVGGLLAVGSESRWLPTVSLGGAFAPSFDAGHGPVRAAVWLLPLRLTPSTTLFRFRRLGPWPVHVDVVASAGLGLDLVHVTPISDTLPLSALRAGTLRVDPMLTTAVGARWYVTRQIAVQIAPGLDADLHTRPYLTLQGQKAQNVFEPWPVRPTLTVTAFFGVWGPP